MYFNNKNVKKNDNTFLIRKKVLKNKKCHFCQFICDDSSEEGTSTER